jgi:prevent-host-death family protein
MPEVTATEAARRFADLLDAVEHHGEHYTIVRRGKVVATIEPVSRGAGTDVKAVLRASRPDTAWATELAAIRDLLEIDDRG